MIVIECDGGTCRIVQRLPSVPLRMISGECSYMVQGYEHMPQRGHWDGRIRLFHKGHRTFPIGLLSVVTDTLDEMEIPWVVRHAETNVVGINLPEINPEFEIRKYQDIAALKAIANQVGVLRMATGAGKTVVAGHIMHRLQMPTVFLVHTKDLLYQAIDSFSSMFGSQHIGQIGDGKIDFSDITVATIQTLSRVFGIEYEKFDDEDDWEDEYTDTNDYAIGHIKECLNQVGVVFMDECHRVAAPTAQTVMENISNPRFRIGLSASPWRDDGADLAIQGCLGPVVHTTTASDLIDMEYLVPPLIRMVDVPPKGFPRGTRYSSVYRDYVVDNEERNALIVRHAHSMVRRRRPTLILVKHIRHGEILQRLISDQIGTWVPFISGRDGALTRKDALDDIREGRNGVLIASTIADEGLDLKPLSGLILAGGGKSSVKALQRIGRTLRPFPGKENAEIVDFVDNAKWLIGHSSAREKIYMTEPRFEITDI